MKYLNIILLVFSFSFFSCDNKEVKNFKPTTKLDLILKNEKLSKAYYDFRLSNIPLSTELAKQKAFIDFVDATNEDGLLLLTECENSIVRCIAFKALVEKDYPKIREILFKHENDNEYIENLRGHCIRMKESVRLYMLEQLSPYSNSASRFNKIEYDKIREEFWKD